MPITYLKKAAKTAESDQSDVQQTVEDMLAAIEAGGDDVAVAYCRQFDKWDGDIVVTREAIDAAIAKVPEKLKRRRKVPGVGLSENGLD